MVQETANSIVDKNSIENLDEKRKKVGNYVILKTIGEGSFAKVRLGIHLVTDMKVAVKVINKREVFKRNYLRANLRREASMMQRMQHSNIVQLHEVMETENSYYIVMDLVQGQEFVKYLTKKRQLDENETRRYIRQIVSAVDHMHRAHVIHRDIKLQNFMLDQNNDIVIIDFGLSNSLDEKGFLTTQCGSPAYAAPEIFAHQEYGPAVDVWSIGVNMYAMLLGKLPFKVEHRSRNLAKLHACILKGCEIPNTLSKECQDLLSRLLEPSPTKRISMQEILRHPFMNYQLGPVEIIPYKPNADMREINRSIIKYLVVKHDYNEREIEEAVLHRKPVAARALYTLIERRLKEGLGWPDRTYTDKVPTNITTTTTVLTTDIVTDKLGRGEPLLPRRRSITQQQSKLTREKSNYAFEDNVLLRGRSTNTPNLTQDAANELFRNDVVSPSRLANRKLYHDIVLRKNSSSRDRLSNDINNDGDQDFIPTPYLGDKSPMFTTKRTPTNEFYTRNNLLPLRRDIGLSFKQSQQQLQDYHPSSITPQPQGQQQNGRTILLNNQRTKPRSLPNSTLDHANQNGFHIPSPEIRTPKALSRTSNIDIKKQLSPVRYNPAQSLTVKHIGLFLKNSALHSRVSSCSSKSSKSTGTSLVDGQSPPSKYNQPTHQFTTTTTPSKPSIINYSSHQNLSRNLGKTAHTKQPGGPSTNTHIQHLIPQKLMPT